MNLSISGQFFGLRIVLSLDYFYPGRVAVGGLSIWICQYVCVCVSSKTRLFTALPFQNRHEIALYSLALQFLFFERRL